MNILGINNYFEHPAVAIISNGEVVFAIEDERMTRIKHGKSYTPYKTYIPYASIYAALKSCGMTFKDIHEVAFSYDRWEHLRNIWGCFTGHRLSSVREELAAFRSAANMWPAMVSGYELPKRYLDVINPEDIKNVRHREWGHHLSHAASAFFCSGFEESLVVVADGSGEQACTSVYLGNKKHLKKIFEVSLPHSLGFFYSFITQHLGFEPFSDEYKVMGLAAYGEDRFKSEMEQLITLTADGGYKVNLKNLNNLELLFGPARKYNEPLQQKHKDISKSAQVMLEEALEHIITFFMIKTGSKNLCLAGGVFLNILANARLIKLPMVKDYFIQPAAHDAGTAIGAAALSWIANGGAPQLKLPSMFLGTEYSNAEIEKTLQIANLAYVKLEESELIQHIADIIAAEKIIALYRGRMEFGPRALGNRSLIASPKSKRTREKLNELKVREQFRPLAPLVTIEDFDKYFIGGKDRYMMLAVEVREEVKHEIPAIVHSDGSARTQVICANQDNFMHRLIKESEKRIGVPVLINTSLNVRGKPIDESPYDAISSFITSGIDYLVIGSFVIRNNFVGMET